MPAELLVSVPFSGFTGLWLPSGPVLTTIVV